MARISKKLQDLIVEAVRDAHHEVIKASVPNTIKVPPDMWTNVETQLSDLIADCEYKAVEAILKVLSAANCSERRRKL